VRSFERFVCCWFLAGLVIFSCAAHQRPDLIFPLIPAAALLAGRVLAGWVDKRQWLVPAGTAIALIGLSYNYIYAIPGRPRFQRTKAAKELASLVKSAGVEVKHVDTPFALQVYLNTKQFPIDATNAVRLLAEPSPVFIATSRSLPVTNAYVLYRWRGPKDEVLELVSNRSRLERD
jgi:4-amino-4-deoxy-L-arabinose transferase-like glycosyltransferase